MISAGIVGASGYMGGEVLRILMDHPGVELAWATSRSAGRIEQYHPNFYGSGIELIHPDEATRCDVVFLALPTDASINESARFLSMGAKVIDLGSAFRLRDRATWESVYGQTHGNWVLAEQAVYGVNELHKAEIENASLIANPGCFSSAAILAMAPLMEEGVVETDKVAVTGISGTAGIGAELSRAAHHPEIGNNVVPYNVVGHRHSFEMEQELSLLAGQKVSVHFTPVYVPIVRGILAVCHVFPLKPVDRSILLERYRAYYRDAPFVKVYDMPKESDASWQYKPYPWVNSVAGTNYCFIGLDYDVERGRIVVLSVLDSIGKGGAQVGVENMNLIFGLERTTGLHRYGQHPC